MWETTGTTVDEYSFMTAIQLGFWSLTACGSLVTLKRAILMEWKSFGLLRSPGNLKHEGSEAVQPLSSQ